MSNMGKEFIIQHPGLLVFEPGEVSPTLVVETTASARDVAASREHLRQHMAHAGVPLGLVVTPERVVLLRHRYTSYDANSIVVLADDLVPGLFGAEGSQVSFEAQVQRWLDGLPSGAGWEHLPSSLAAALRDEIVPVLLAGPVRTSGPRYETHASP